MAYNIVVDPDSLSALFGIPHNKELSAEVKHAISFCTLLARRLILLNWKNVLPPSYDRWIKEVLHDLKLERLRFSLRGFLKNFDKVWNPVLQRWEVMKYKYIFQVSVLYLSIYFPHDF